MKRRLTSKQVTEINERMEFPEIPKLRYHDPGPRIYVVECRKCGNRFDSAVKSMAVIQCHRCWAGKPSAPSRYTFKGLKCKTKLPK